MSKQEYIPERCISCILCTTENEGEKPYCCYYDKYTEETSDWGLNKPEDCKIVKIILEEE